MYTPPSHSYIHYCTLCTHPFTHTHTHTHTAIHTHTYVHAHRHTHVHTHRTMSNSTASDDAKKDARKNILLAISGSVSPPPQTNVPTVAEPSVDNLALDNKLRVSKVVKALQGEVRRDGIRPHPPSIKPRKSPNVSPSRSVIM